METKEFGRSNSRSRRSHTNLSNLRLAPLSTDFDPDAASAPVADTDLSYQVHHSSYIQGRSAPSTPGILGRSSSRRQLGAGLSRKLSIYDNNAPGYGAVEVNRDGVPLNALRPDSKIGSMPKAQSEAALLLKRQHPAKLHSQLSQHSGGGGGGGAGAGGTVRHHRRSHTAGRPLDPKEDDWLTRAGMTTTSILRESKGQSWLVSRDSSTSLAADHSDDEDRESIARMSASSHLRLHFADDELSPETPRHNTSTWGSRFGSRAASARNSRRGSIDQARTPAMMAGISQDDYFFDQFRPEQRAEAVKPDFVDADDEGADEEDAEEEIARLARERSFGFGGLVDRLVGWTLFNVDEDRETTDVEDDNDDKNRAKGGMNNNAAATRRPPPARNAQTPSQAAREPRPEGQEEGGWQDAAWLLSLASKVIL